MASKFGRLAFGQDLYSFHPSVDFEGSLAFTMLLAGRATRLFQSMQGAVSFGIGGTSGVGRNTPLVSNLVTTTSLSGVLAYTHLFGGALPFAVALTGGLYKTVGLQGAVPFTVSFAGVFGHIHPFVASLPFTVAFAGTVNRVYSLVSNLNVNFALTGGIYNTIGLRANLPVNLDLTGELFRAAERQFEATMPIQIDLNGSLSILQDFVASMEFAVAIGGSDTIYIGPFWDPDEPTDGFWVPDVYPSNPITEFWVPDTPQEEIWASDTPINQDWFPSHPQVVPGTEKLPFGINAFGIGLYSLSVPPIPLQIWVPIPQERNYNG